MRKIELRFILTFMTVVLAALIACDAQVLENPSRPLGPVSPAIIKPLIPQEIHSQRLPATPLPPKPVQTVVSADNLKSSIVIPTVSSQDHSIQTPKVAIKSDPVFPVMVEDGNGNNVKFEYPPVRILAFDSAAVEILFAIGEGHRIVGTHQFVTFPPEANELPRVGDAFNMDIEATVALEPDLVFIFFDHFRTDLERAGLKVLYIPNLTDDFHLVADRIRLWGGITGNRTNAERVATDFENRVSTIIQIMANYASGLTVFQDEGSLWTPGQGTLMQQVFDTLKLTNIASDITGYQQISPEVILERNPAVIIASYGDAISGDPIFKDVLAVRNKSIFVPSSDALSIAGPRFVQGIEELARWVYPGLFP